MNGEEQIDPAPIDAADEQAVLDAPVEAEELPVEAAPVAFPPEDMPPVVSGWELKPVEDAKRLAYWNAALRLWVHVYPRDNRLRDPSDVDLPRCILYRGFEDGTVLAHRAIASGEDFQTVAASFTVADERAWICEYWARRLGRGWRHDHSAADHGLTADDKKAYAADMKRLVAVSPDPYRDVRLAWWSTPEDERPVAAQ